MGRISVRSEGGDRFVVGVRDHVLHVDQPVSEGGEDTAPTPTELFVAGLASCVAHYARRYLARHDLPTEGLEVRAEYAFAGRPSRVGSITMELVVPEGVPADRHEALLAVAGHCTVHNTLTVPPDVQLGLQVAGARSTA